MQDVTTHPYPNFNDGLIEVRAWMSNYMLQFYTDVINYPYHSLNVDLDNISQ